MWVYGTCFLRVVGCLKFSREILNRKTYLDPEEPTFLRLLVMISSYTS